MIDFVQSNLEHELPFILTAPTGHKFEAGDQDQTLVQLKLVPASILNFQFDGNIVENIQSIENLTYLKPEVMMTVQSL